jgi:hypothetical protein
MLVQCLYACEEPCVPVEANNHFVAFSDEYGPGYRRKVVEFDVARIGQHCVFTVFLLLGNYEVVI